MEKILPRECNRRIGRAMHAYGMLADGDRVLVAVSGGIDSQVLVRVLHDWRRKAPIDYRLLAVHVDMEPAGGHPGQAAADVRRLMHSWGIPLEIIPAAQPPARHFKEDSRSRGDFCYLCARRRRKQLFDHARASGCNKLALGHHREDIIETFFLNLFYSGNLSTMVPRQLLFDGNLAVIRPLAYLTKNQVGSLAGVFSLSASPNPCPLAGSSKRETIRTMLGDLYARDEHLESRIFAALSNVRLDYLL